MSDEDQKLISALNAAGKRLSGSGGKSATGIEKAYGEAYQACVRAGLLPQIKKRYR